MDRNTAWEAFLRTGRVVDYIRYRQMVAQSRDQEEAYEDGEQRYADSDQGDGPFGARS